MSIRTILESKEQKILTVEENTKVLDAVKKMGQMGIGSIIATKDGKLSGIFTERDLLRLVAKDHTSLETTVLKNVMSTHITAASIDDTVDDVLNTMITKKFRHMPVIDGENFIGLISIGDAVKDKLEKTQKDLHVLQEFVGGGGQGGYIKP